MNSRFFIALLGLTFVSAFARGADPETPVSAKDLAASLAARQEGTAYVRLRLEAKQGGATKETMQIQIKERRTRNSADVMYQVMWPKERKGQAVLLHKSGGRPATGTILMPPDKAHALSGSQMSEPLFGSDLSYQDVIEDFFAWDNQAIVGNEAVDRVNCVILESKPGNDASPYTSVKSWIDARRVVPLRVEKYSGSGKLVRRIETTRVANDDKGHAIPANLLVHSSRDATTTEVDGSRIRHGVALSDKDFTPEGLTDTTAPHSGGE